MKKGKFYKLKKKFYPLQEGEIYILLEESKLGDKFIISIGKVHAVLVDRVITSKTFEFIADKKEKVFNKFEEIPLEHVRKKIDNTDALLSKQIFRR